MALGQLFRSRWRELEGKTPLTPAEVARAGELGFALVEALGQREAGTDDANAADAYAVRAPSVRRRRSFAAHRALPVPERMRRTPERMPSVGVDGRRRQARLEGHTRSGQGAVVR
jgi:hypothetical protein